MQRDSFFGWGCYERVGVPPSAPVRGALFLGLLSAAVGIPSHLLSPAGMVLRYCRKRQITQEGLGQGISRSVLTDAQTLLVRPVGNDGVNSERGQTEGLSL